MEIVQARARRGGRNGDEDLANEIEGARREEWASMSMQAIQAGAEDDAGGGDDDGS